MVLTLLKKNKKMILIIITSLFLFGTIGPFIEVKAYGVITYTGYVRDMGGSPLEGATVYISIGIASDTDITDGSGYYSVSADSGGHTGDWYDVTLRASCDGYITKTHTEDDVLPGSYSHNFNLAEDTSNPSLSWVSPAAGALVTFPPSHNDFTFSYSAQDIDQVKLYLAPDGEPLSLYGTYTEMGSSVEKTVDLGADMDELHGLVDAELRGYESGTTTFTLPRTFNFSKQISVIDTKLDDGFEDLGNQLYLIIYDPPGDHSYSTHTEETKTMRTNSISVDAGFGMEIKAGKLESNVGAECKFNLDVNYGYEYEWAQTDIDISELSSSINTHEKNYVGPGYGDVYWGEREALIWEIWATNITYADGSYEYTGPMLYTGMDYSENILVSRDYAPNAWLQQNPNINSSIWEDPDIIEWDIQNAEIQGGTGDLLNSHEEISTKSHTHKVTIEVSNQVRIGLGWGSLAFELSLKTQYTHNSEFTESVKTTYYIHDDDSVDYFHYDVGTDKRFGVPVFRNTPNENPLLQSKSSTPWEYNTRDVLPPENTAPVITLDTDGDGLYPTEGDTPLIELELTDEAEITTATVIYSDDGGAGWNTVNLQERIAEPNSWYANIPSHEHETTIWWYIHAKDANDNSKVIKDADDNYFEYMIISRPPTVELLSPNLGGSYKENILIEWSGSDPDDDDLTYTIGYQISGGGWVLIATGLTNTSYLWDVSGMPDSNAVSVIVYADDGYCSAVSDTSDFVFTIDNDDIPEVSFTAPQSGLSYGGTVSISWSIVDVDEFITGFILYYSVSSGSPTWLLINDSLMAEMVTTDWDSAGIIFSETVRLKIVANNSLDASVEAITGLFTIDNRPDVTLNLLTPNGGEIINENCTITWSLAIDEPLVIYEIKLEYSSNGVNWTTIATGIQGTSYNWDTSAIPPGANYRVRMTLTATYQGIALDPTIEVSDTAFIITHTTNISGLPFLSFLATIVFAGIPVLLKRKRK